MIFNIPVAGLKEVSCKFLGAPGETFTLLRNGSTAYSNVPENSSVAIKQGKYTIRGSIAETDKEITIKDAGTYTTYPAGALYWYGREVQPITVTHGGSKGSYSTKWNADKEANRILLYVQSRGYLDGSTYRAMMVTTSAVNTSGYSRIYFKTTSHTAGHKNHTINGGYKSNNQVGAFNSAITVGTVYVSSPKTTAYVGCGVSASPGGDEDYGKVGIYVDAVWLE